MEKGLSPKARELLEKIRAAEEKGITSQEMRKLGDLGHAPLDELLDKDLIAGRWETQGDGSMVYVFKIRRTKLERIESGEQKRKATDAKQKFSRQFVIAIGKLLIAIVIALLLLALAWSSPFLPLVVFFLCSVAIWYITSKHEEWFYPKRKDKS